MLLLSLYINTLSIKTNVKLQKLSLLIVMATIPFNILVKEIQGTLTQATQFKLFRNICTHL